MSQQVIDECKHDTAISITVYETSATVYTVEDGEIDLYGGEELEPDPTGDVSISCHDCGEDWFFGCKDEIPEPWKTMVQRIFHEVSSD